VGGCAVIPEIAALEQLKLLAARWGSRGARRLPVADRMAERLEILAVRGPEIPIDVPELQSSYRVRSK
jgi:hypothetical protein